ncbi:MAG: TIGR02281 family clan AA aspartic protease [Rhodobacteraceae bacterium]|nr:TIGR02281 family clan AA aspartic protease [Paracoccaceae bacterium]
MSNLQTGHLTYLLLLAVAVLFWFVTNHRQSFRKTVQQGMAWALIFIGIIVAYGMWGDIRSTITPRASVYSDAGRVVIPRSPDGHYRLTLDVNGAKIRFVVDTGASNIVLSKNDAKKAGLDPASLPYFGRALTANGEVKTAPVVLDEIRLGDMVDTRVSAQVNGGELNQSLLGMTYLNHWREITISDGRLILQR